MQKQNLLKRLLSFTRPYLLYLILALILAVFSVSLALYAPVLTGRAIDLVVGRGQVNFEALKSVLFTLGTVVAATSFSQWLMGLFTNKITYLSVRDIRVKAFERLQKVPLRFVDSNAHGDILSRAWVFRTVGYGHGQATWNAIISTLKAVGYDGAISIEHEDGLMSPKEGLEKAIALLKNVLIYETPGQMWWV